MRLVGFRLLTRAALAALVVIAALLASTTGTLAAPGNTGAVYTSTNAAAGNAVVVFDRAADGSLTQAGSYATGGLGTGSGLGSQGAVTLSQDNRVLLVVNAGSDDLSVFAVRGDELQLTDRVPSGGDRPISVTVHGNVVFVLNAGSETISGFTLSPKTGTLTPLANSTRSLSAGGNPAQVQFSRDGKVLVVTEKGTHQILTFTVRPNGAVSDTAQVFASSGTVPFGFDFDNQGHLIVSEAGARAASSYAVTPNGDVTALSASVPTHQIAACWVVVTKNGKFAYVANAGSEAITGYAIDNNGSLSLLDADGVTGDTGAGSRPLDMALSNNGQFLYDLSAFDGTIAAFEVNADGSLTMIGRPGDALIVGAAGLAAR